DSSAAMAARVAGLWIKHAGGPTSLALSEAIAIRVETNPQPRETSVKRVDTAGEEVRPALSCTREGAQRHEYPGRPDALSVITRLGEELRREIADLECLYLSPRDQLASQGQPLEDGVCCALQRERLGDIDGPRVGPQGAKQRLQNFKPARWRTSAVEGIEINTREGSRLGSGAHRAALRDL